MQITRQADYALRAMLYLARLDPEQKASTSQIAEKQSIPPSFLAKIISQLSIAGLIQTSRGAKGGVSLSKPASEISMLQVVEAIDGPVQVNICTFSKDECKFEKDCPVHMVWCDIQNDIINKLRDTKFSKLIGASAR